MYRYVDGWMVDRLNRLDIFDRQRDDRIDRDRED